MSERQIHGITVLGVDVDPQTRCAHYHSERDVIAILFRCCYVWYPCIDCHREIAGHETKLWPADEFSAEAVLCGACGHKMRISEYLGSHHRCPACGHEFNPGCFRHQHFYFAVPEQTAGSTG